MSNRRQRKAERVAARTGAELWESRGNLALVICYGLLFSWLFSGASEFSLRPSEALSLPAEPVWKPPGREHWFGTSGTGTDLFNLSRRAMGRSAAAAAIISALGAAFALLLASLFAFSGGVRRVSFLKVVSRIGALLPAFLLLVIVAGASEGNFAISAATLVCLIGIYLCPSLVGWFEEAEKRPDMLAGRVLGLTRAEQLTSRVLPQVARRLVGVSARLIPVVILTEMALSFLGFTGNFLSCGAIIAHGREILIEAPWVTIFPGLFAMAVVALLSLLGGITAAFSKSGRTTKFF